MMTPEDIYSALDAIAPTAYRAFPDDDPDSPAPAPPFIVYYSDGNDDLFADNLNYARIYSLTVELYTDNKDWPMEAAVEAALTSLGLTFTRSETYISSERLYQTTYTMEALLEPPTED